MSVCEPEIGRDQECVSSPWQPSTSTFLFNPYLIYACEKKNTLQNLIESDRDRTISITSQ